MASALARHQKILGPFKRKLTTRRTVLSIAPLPIGSFMALSLAYTIRLRFLTKYSRCVRIALLLRPRQSAAVYLHPADKYYRLTRRPSQGQKDLDERALRSS